MITKIVYGRENFFCYVGAFFLKGEDEVYQDLAPALNMDEARDYALRLSRFCKGVRVDGHINKDNLINFRLFGEVEGRLKESIVKVPNGLTLEDSICYGITQLKEMGIVYSKINKDACLFVA